MSKDTILVAEHQGSHIIKFVGDVRLTFSVALDNYIAQMLESDDFCCILFDMTETQLVDSTTLGLIAKIGIYAYESGQHKPLIVCDNPSLCRLLDSMGITDVCDLISTLPGQYSHMSSGQALEATGSMDDIQATVLDAHCVLMGMSKTNEDTFKDLVKTLKSA